MQFTSAAADRAVLAASEEDAAGRDLTTQWNVPGDLVSEATRHGTPLADRAAPGPPGSLVSRKTRPMGFAMRVPQTLQPPMPGLLIGYAASRPTSRISPPSATPSKRLAWGSTASASTTA